MDAKRPTVMVSGCFDGLHSGHVAFLQSAAAFGDLHVSLGSDATVMGLKGRPPRFPASERLYLVQALACVSRAFIASGTGMLDFAAELEQLRPSLFVVNQDGDTPAKQELCRRIGVEYRVLERRPAPGQTPRSSTALHRENRLPFRIDLAGGWLDQPFVSSLWPGPVLTVSIEPTHEFNDRSGMATSTRHTAQDLWGGQLPAGAPEALAKMLFACENPPGTVDVAGSQDAIGMVFPGFNRSNYNGHYWPQVIDSVTDEATLQFLEQHLALVPLEPRHSAYHPLRNCRISREGARALADAAQDCWSAALAHDLRGFGSAVRRSFEAQIEMFPSMLVPEAADAIARVQGIAAGWKLSGAGGGGYLVAVVSGPLAGAVSVRIRRP